MSYKIQKPWEAIYYVSLYYDKIINKETLLPLISTFKIITTVT